MSPSKVLELECNARNEFLSFFKLQEDITELFLARFGIKYIGTKRRYHSLAIMIMKICTNFQKSQVQACLIKEVVERWRLSVDLVVGLTSIQKAA